MAICKTCGAEIIWCETSSGKLMPLDAKPERRFVLGEAAGHGDGTRKARSADTYTSHFVACPQADEHRRPR
jgi:hypothetical protein